MTRNQVSNLVKLAVLMVITTLALVAAVDTNRSVFAFQDTPAQAPELPSDEASADDPMSQNASPSDSCGQGEIWDTPFHKWTLSQCQQQGNGTYCIYNEYWWHVVTWHNTGTTICWL